MPMEKPTPAPGTITLTITHPEKERYELCEISCGAATTSRLIAASNRASLHIAVDTGAM